MNYINLKIIYSYFVTFIPFNFFLKLPVGLFKYNINNKIWFKGRQNMQALFNFEAFSVSCTLLISQIIIKNNPMGIGF